MKKEEMINWIDNASYEELLNHLKFAPSTPFFAGEVKKHFMKVLSEREKEINNKEHKNRYKQHPQD